MTTLSVRLPDSLHRRARSLAKEEHISINQLLASALGEKIAALDTESYIKNRAGRASREKFLAALDKAPDIEPPAGDRLSEGS